MLHLEREAVKVERIAEQVVAQRRALFMDHSPWEHSSLRGRDCRSPTSIHVRVEQVLTIWSTMRSSIRRAEDRITIRITAKPRSSHDRRHDRGVGNTPEQSQRLRSNASTAWTAPIRPLSERRAPGGCSSAAAWSRRRAGASKSTASAGQGSTFWFTLPLFAEVTEGAKQVLMRAGRLSGGACWHDPRSRGGCAHPGGG